MTYIIRDKDLLTLLTLNFMTATNPLSPPFLYRITQTHRTLSAFYLVLVIVYEKDKTVPVLNLYAEGFNIAKAQST